MEKDEFTLIIENDEFCNLERFTSDGETLYCQCTSENSTWENNEPNHRPRVFSLHFISMAATFNLFILL